MSNEEAANSANVDEFLAASVEGRARLATGFLRAHPDIAARSLLAAAVLGEAEAVREKLAADATTAVAMDDKRGWPPLLFACYSQWHQFDPDRASGLTEVVRLLLEAGASPNTNDGGRQLYRSALKGSVEVNNPDITEVLLDAGANPDPGQPISEAIGHPDHRCLHLLLAHGARVAGTWALGAAVYNDNPVATSLLLDVLRSSGGNAADAATEELGDAAANASSPVVAALLDGGADPNATSEGGLSALRLAVRAGKEDTAALLRAAGATADGSSVDRFVGACLRADRPAVDQLLIDTPDLLELLTDEDRAVIFDAAGSGPAEAVALMLSLGFSPDTGRWGERPLHTAAYNGNAGAVRLLLEAGAEVDARDARFDSTALAFATVGSGERLGEPGDWIETVRLLIEAGASREGAWILDKPPSEEVMDLVRLYGITSDEQSEPSEQTPDDESDAPSSTGGGVMADMAQHLQAAYRDGDLDLLGSLLHPEVHWTGVCTNRKQVLDWYRGLQAAGTTATIENVEVDRDAVLFRLSVEGRAEGARPAPPQRVYQVFTVEDGQVVDVRGYPDRVSAIART